MSTQQTQNSFLDPVARENLDRLKYRKLWKRRRPRQRKHHIIKSYSVMHMQSCCLTFSLPFCCIQVVAIAVVFAVVLLIGEEREVSGYWSRIRRSYAHWYNSTRDTLV